MTQNAKFYGTTQFSETYIDFHSQNAMKAWQHTILASLRKETNLCIGLTCAPYYITVYEILWNAPIVRAIKGGLIVSIGWFSSNIGNCRLDRNIGIMAW